MAQDATQRRAAAKKLAEIIFSPATLARFDWDQLTAAIGSIDDTMNALPAALTAGQTIKQNINNRLPEPFKSTATIEEKANALACWATKEAGLI